MAVTVHLPGRSARLYCPHCQWQKKRHLDRSRINQLFHQYFWYINSDVNNWLAVLTVIKKYFNHIVVCFYAGQMQRCAPIFVPFFCIRPALKCNRVFSVLTKWVSCRDSILRSILTWISRMVAISVLLFTAAICRGVMLFLDSGSLVISGHFPVILLVALKQILLLWRKHTIVTVCSYGQQHNVNSHEQNCIARHRFG